MHTCHGEVLRIACLDGLVEVEVVLPSRLVSMENLRNRGEEEPLSSLGVSQESQTKMMG